MRLRTVVALTDFSSVAEQALERAALLAAAHQARLQILYGTEAPDPKFVDPQARLAQRARQLARRHDLAVTPLDYGAVGVVEAVLRAAREADLLVVHALGAEGLAAWWRGDTLARLLRASPCPVLLVRQAAQAAYAHVLVDVASASASQALVRYAGALEAAAAVELFHTPGVRGAAAPGTADALHAYRDELRQRARGRRVRLSDVFEARRNRVDMNLGAAADDRARQLAVQRHRSGADLVALAQPRRGWLADMLRGSVARQLLAGVDCDVLVHPLDDLRVDALAVEAQSRVARRCTQAI